jgi:hypothetical protein
MAFGASLGVVLGAPALDRGEIAPTDLQNPALPHQNGAETESPESRPVASPAREGGDLVEGSESQAILSS